MDNANLTIGLPLRQIGTSAIQKHLQPQKSLQTSRYGHAIYIFVEIKSQRRAINRLLSISGHLRG